MAEFMEGSDPHKAVVLYGQGLVYYTKIVIAMETYFVRVALPLWAVMRFSDSSPALLPMESSSPFKQGRRALPWHFLETTVASVVTGANPSLMCVIGACLNNGQIVL